MMTDDEATATESDAAAAPDDDYAVPVEVEVVVQDGEASLVLIAADQSALEIPLSKRDCLSLGVALLNFVYPHARLQATPPAGRG
jgi:hypothetical protein